MKKMVWVAIAIITCTTATAQYDPEAKAILDAMSNNYKNIGSFTSDFSQKLTNDVAEIEESVSGTIKVKGEKYVLDVAGQQIFNDAVNVWTYNEEIAEVTVSPFDPEEQEISLNNIWDIYKEGFKYILLSSNEKGNHVVDLDPVSRDKSYFKIRMVINPQSELKAFTVFENEGNKFEYTIKSFAKAAHSDEIFTFNSSKYPDVEVIDFR